MVVTMQYMFSDSVTQLEDQYIEISWNVGQYVMGCSVTNTKWVDAPSLEKPFPLDL